MITNRDFCLNIIILFLLPFILIGCGGSASTVASDTWSTDSAPSIETTSNIDEMPSYETLLKENLDISDDVFEKAMEQTRKNLAEEFIKLNDLDQSTATALRKSFKIIDLAELIENEIAAVMFAEALDIPIEQLKVAHAGAIHRYREKAIALGLISQEQASIETVYTFLDSNQIVKDALNASDDEYSSIHESGGDIFDLATQMRLEKNEAIDQIVKESEEAFKQGVNQAFDTNQITSEQRDYLSLRKFCDSSLIGSTDYSPNEYGMLVNNTTSDSCLLYLIPFENEGIQEVFVSSGSASTQNSGSSSPGLSETSTTPSTNLPKNNLPLDNGFSYVLKTKEIRGCRGSNYLRLDATRNGQLDGITYYIKGKPYAVDVVNTPVNTGDSFIYCGSVSDLTINSRNDVRWQCSSQQRDISGRLVKLCRRLEQE